MMFLCFTMLILMIGACFIKLNKGQRYTRKRLTVLIGCTQREHNVETTSIQLGVESTLFQRCVPAGYMYRQWPPVLSNNLYLKASFRSSKWKISVNLPV